MQKAARDPGTDIRDPKSASRSSGVGQSRSIGRFHGAQYTEHRIAWITSLDGLDSRPRRAVIRLYLFNDQPPPRHGSTCASRTCASMLLLHWWITVPPHGLQLPPKDTDHYIHNYASNGLRTLSRGRVMIVRITAIWTQYFLSPISELETANWRVTMSQVWHWISSRTTPFPYAKPKYNAAISRSTLATSTCHREIY
jgi:hypothetical protein